MSNPYLLRAAESLELMAKELRTMATNADPSSENRHILEMIIADRLRNWETRLSAFEMHGNQLHDHLKGMVESQEKSLVAHHTRVWLLEQLNIADRLTRLEKDHLRTDDLGAK